MSSIQATRLRKGMLIKFGADLCRILDLYHITPGNKRAHVQCKLRDIRSGRLLDHKFRSEGLVTITVKPGFVKTSMTEGLKPPPFASEPEDVAAQVLRAIDKKKPVVYPPPWSLVMFVIRLLPRFVMRRIGF